MTSRRQMLKLGGGMMFGLGTQLLGGERSVAFAAETVKLPFDHGERQLVRFPGKRPLISQTARPPQLETPFSVFNEGLVTPNDAFFVRYHLAGLPLEIDPDAFRLEIKGQVARSLLLSLQELKTTFPQIEMVAVNQCSGNSRGFVAPRVAGGQFGNGAMGNALWKGVSLKAVLDRAGVQSGAMQVVFRGLDRPILPETPHFMKALPIDHARDGEVMLAYAMNGSDLPWLNGYPLRLIVPGYYGTYWVKHLNEIVVVDKEFDGFWMKSAYRIPDNDCVCIEAGGQSTTTVPIGRLNVRSFITSVENGDTVKAGDLALRGIAFDGGYGLTEVVVSADGGASWVQASLGQVLSRYSFREWKATLPVRRGECWLSVRATNRRGQTQPMQATWNPSGYMRNAVETTRVTAI